MKRWYVVHCQPQGEAKAVFNLRRQGFAPFLPRYRKSVRHARRTHSLLAPLFPRYLFVSLDLDGEPWRSINGTFGVIGLVGFGGRPTPVPDAVMAALVARCDADGATELTAPVFIKGQPVRVTEGPFSEAIGLFEDMDDERRVTLLLDLLGRPVKVALPADRVAAA